MKKILIGVILVIVAVIIGAGIVVWKLAEHFHQGGSESIALGQPCDFKQIASWGAGGFITDTNGLQCYLYEATGSPIAQGVWVYPARMNQPIFASAGNGLFNSLFRDWKTYQTDHFSFQYPNSWIVSADPHPSEGVTIQMPDLGPGLRIDYIPNNFTTTEDYQAINTLPDDVMAYRIANNKIGEFDLARSFTMNGMPTFMLEEMQTVSTLPYQVTVYMEKENAYVRVFYEKYTNDPSIDIPFEMIITSIKQK